MTIIQGGSNSWIDAFARYTGGPIGLHIRPDLLNATAAADPTLWGSDQAHGMIAIISDLQEEGELGELYEQPRTTASKLDTLSDDLEAGEYDLRVVDEIVTATAKRIGMIEAATRGHPPGAMGSFGDQDNASNYDPTKDSFAESLAAAMKQNPDLAMATVCPTKNRIAIFSLLL
jgi:hypothetical protein